MNYQRKAVRDLANQDWKALDNAKTFEEVITDPTTVRLFYILLQLYGHPVTPPSSAFTKFLEILDQIDLDLLPKIVDISAHELMNFLADDDLAD